MSAGERLIYVQELAHAVVGSDTSKVCPAGQQPENSSRSWCSSLESKGAVWRQNSFLCKRLLSSPWRPLRDGMRLTHSVEGNLLDSKSAGWNTNHIWKKAFTGTSPLVFGQTLGIITQLRWHTFTYHSLHLRWDLSWNVGSYDNTEWVGRSRKRNEIRRHWEKRAGVDVIGTVCKKYYAHSRITVSFFFHVFIVVSCIPCFSLLMSFSQLLAPQALWRNATVLSNRNSFLVCMLANL